MEDLLAVRANGIMGLVCIVFGVFKDGFDAVAHVVICFVEELSVM